jgi:hypothetical protein
LQAQRASDAKIFVDDRKRPWPLNAVIQIQRNDRHAQQAREADHPLLASRRALVVVCLACCNGFSIRAACGVAAFGALRLGQPVFDLVGECLGRGCSHYGHINGLLITAWGGGANGLGEPGTNAYNANGSLIRL